MEDFLTLLLHIYLPQRILRVVFVVLVSKRSRQEEDDSRGNEQEASDGADGDANHERLRDVFLAVFTTVPPILPNTTPTHTHTRVKQNTHTLPQLQLIMFSWHLYLFSKEQNNLASWKKHFNSLNKGTITHFVLNYKVFIKLKWYYNTFNLININTS